MPTITQKLQLIRALYDALDVVYIAGRFEQEISSAPFTTDFSDDINRAIAVLDGIVAKLRINIDNEHQKE